MSDVAGSAAIEWAHLVTAAVLGTDRHPPQPAAPGWEPLTPAPDGAVELLNRAAAVATARRAGVRPAPTSLRIEPAPDDVRPMCSPAAARILQTLLGGEHAVLLPEWLARATAAGVKPPPHLVPTMLLRGRRNAAFDVAARKIIGPLAAWLAEAMPELGVKPSAATPAPGDVFAPPPAPPDSAAIVTAIVEIFLDRSATWAAAPQLRLAVASIAEPWLPALVLELNRAPFHATTERTRVDLLALAQLRQAMVAALPVPEQPKL